MLNHYFCYRDDNCHLKTIEIRENQQKFVRFVTENFNWDNAQFYRVLELRFLKGQRLSWFGRIILTIPLLILSLILQVCLLFTINEEL